MPFKVGLTGGIASGKSTIADLFAALNVPVIDADIIARQLVAPGAPCYQAVVDLFGVDCLQADGTLNRAYLRKQIFNHADLRQQLENILHPAIRTLMQKQADNQSFAYVILVIPLLFETGMQQDVDRSLTVDINAETQLERLCQRDNMTTEAAQKMLSSQFSRDHRLQLTDDIIDNNGSLAILSQQVEQLHQHYLKLSGAL